VSVLVVLLVVVVLAVVGGAAAVVSSGRRRFAAANEVVAGTPTPAPAAWAGAHSPEARLHRRLRDAVSALRANPGLEDAWALESRVSLEQHALAVDERLVAVAALPEGVRAEPLGTVAAAVDAVEAAVASLATAGPGLDRHSGLDQAMAQVEARVAQLAEG
jgi:hypothetical protein